jgi:hypothetical protein
VLLPVDRHPVLAPGTEKKSSILPLPETHDRDLLRFSEVGGKNISESTHFLSQPFDGMVIPGLDKGEGQVDVSNAQVHDERHGIRNLPHCLGCENAVDFKPDVGVVQDILDMCHGQVEAAFFPVCFLGKAVEAEYDRKLVGIQGLEDLSGDQTAVGGQGIPRLFAVFPVFRVEEGEGFLDQAEAKKGFSPVEIEVVSVGQKRQKKTAAFLAVANVMRSCVFFL